MPIRIYRGRKVKWQHTFSFGDKEKEFIERYMEEEDETFNGAIRKIIIECGKIRGYNKTNPLHEEEICTSNNF